MIAASKLPGMSCTGANAGGVYETLTTSLVLSVPDSVRLTCVAVTATELTPTEDHPGDRGPHPSAPGP